MSHMDNTASAEAGRLFNQWLPHFSAAMEAQEARAVLGLFDADGHWKDFLAFTWQHRTFSGKKAIGEALSATIRSAAPRDVRLAKDRTQPRLLRRSGRTVLEAYFDFRTKVGIGSGFVRLLIDGAENEIPRIWLLLTTLQELDGHRERTGTNRPTGNEFAMNELGLSWREHREAKISFADRDPEVIVIGAAQAGLTIAARLGQIGVDTLVVEKMPRIGDVWRERYESLTLHNEVMANHLPFIPFPDTWPLWLSKDQLANWLEAYASLLELTVWTSTRFAGGTFDEKSKRWTVQLERADGVIVEKTCRHIVMATGVSGSVPNVPDLPGIAEFKGEVLHSAHFRNGVDFSGKDVAIVGSGNSGHDVAQDLFVKGARNIYMLQRGPTCVVSLNPTAAMVYKVYSEGLPTEDIDLLNAAIPYPILEDTYRRITQKGAELDRDLLASLEKAGLKCYFGPDGTGFQMIFMRGEGAYYIDVGCAKLIADGKVKIIQVADTDSFDDKGLKLKDGKTIPLDGVVLATGFRNMQETVRMVFGDKIADRVGKIWGFDEFYQMKNMWRRTAQPGLWFTGGSLLDSRIYSRFLALEICAEIHGILPPKEDLYP